MENTSFIKVAKTSRAAIDSISNAKEEYSALIAKIDKIVVDDSQLVRMSSETSNNQQIGQINKLKMQRRKLHEMLMKMELMKDGTWELLRPEVQKIYGEAAAAVE